MLLFWPYLVAGPWVLALAARMWRGPELQIALRRLSQPGSARRSSASASASLRSCSNALSTDWPRRVCRATALAPPKPAAKEEAEGTQKIAGGEF